MIISTSKVDYHTRANLDITSALVATDYKDPPIILRGGGGDMTFKNEQKGGDEMMDVSTSKTVVRRLTPL